jgi:hypothetical protein
MKPSLNTRCLRPIYLIASLCLPLFGLSPVVAGTRDPLISDPVRPGLDYRMEVSKGYLIVYSATDRVDDGSVPYYPHSSYTIYTLDGKLVKTVANHVSDSDETPDLVSLPVGPYLIEAQSEQEGLLRVHVLIRAGALTALNLEGERTDTQGRLAKVRHSRRLAKR